MSTMHPIVSNMMVFLFTAMNHKKVLDLMIILSRFCNNRDLVLA